MRKFIFILPFIIFFTSCYSPRYVYSPATQNIPLLSKKNDLFAAGFFALNPGGTHSALNATNTSLGLDLHAAYAFTNHFAIIINKYNRWEKNNNGNDFFSGDSLEIKYKRGLTEMGGGYFTALSNNNTYLQLFGGAAFGKFNINEHSSKAGSNFSRFHESTVTKFFIQPAIIAGQQRNFTASFSLRFTAVIFHHIKTDYSAAELDDYFLTGISASPVFFWEPAMSYTFGFKKLRPVKFEVQTGLSVLMNRRFVDYRSFNLALGLVANLYSHKKNRAAKN